MLTSSWSNVKSNEIDQYYKNDFNTYYDTMYSASIGTSGSISSPGIGTFTTGLGGGGGTISNNVYSISSMGAIGSPTGLWQGWQGSIYGSTSPGVTIASGHNTDSDITLKRHGKPEIRIGETLDLITESLCIVIPDKKELEKNPALKSAYEEWQLEFKNHYSQIGSLKTAYDSYNTIKSLCHDAEENE